MKRSREDLVLAHFVLPLDLSETIAWHIELEQPTEPILFATVCRSWRAAIHTVLMHWVAMLLQACDAPELFTDTVWSDWTLALGVYIRRHQCRVPRPLAEPFTPDYLWALYTLVHRAHFENGYLPPEKEHELVHTRLHLLANEIRDAYYLDERTQRYVPLLQLPGLTIAPLERAVAGLEKQVREKLIRDPIASDYADARNRLALHSFTLHKNTALQRADAHSILCGALEHQPPTPRSLLVNAVINGRHLFNPANTKLCENTRIYALRSHDEKLKLRVIQALHDRARYARTLLARLDKEAGRGSRSIYPKRYIPPNRWIFDSLDTDSELSDAYTESEDDSVERVIRLSLEQT